MSTSVPNSGSGKSGPGRPRRDRARGRGGNEERNSGRGSEGGRKTGGGRGSEGGPKRGGGRGSEGGPKRGGGRGSEGGTGRGPWRDVGRGSKGDSRRDPKEGRDRGSGSGESSRGPKPIPAPPDLGRQSSSVEEAHRGADGPREFRIERVDDSPSEAPASTTKSQSGGRHRPTRNRRSRVYVDDVAIGNVASATAVKLRKRLAEAATAFEAERFIEADRLLSSINRISPDVAEVHELLGLTHYRLGRWRRAISELERFHELTRSVEQHPVLADCYRALKDWDRAEALWFELGAASPSPELIEEGRIVQAGALADRDRLVEAIRFLERAPKVKGKPGIHHLRRWYATADLYERAGDNSRARRLFSDITNADPNFGDAAERAAGL